MSNISPYKLFWDWCFDNKKDSPIPEPEVLLKYNSPINEVFLLRSLICNAKLNHYLNEYMNNIGIRYIDREELFHFIKKCIQDFRVRRKEINFVPFKRTDVLVQKLSFKFPLYKPFEIELLAKLVQKDKNKEAIYEALGLEKPKKEKLKKREKVNKISLSTFLKSNFKTSKVTLKKL